MQHAESLMKADDSGGGKKESSAPVLPSEDAPRFVVFPIFLDDVGGGVQWVRPVLMVLPVLIVLLVLKILPVLKVRIRLSCRRL